MPIQPAVVAQARVDDERITFALVDGRELSLPTARSHRLAAATSAERASFQVVNAGTVVEWPLVDEHIGVWTLLGVPEEDVLRAAGFDVMAGPVDARR